MPTKYFSGLINSNLPWEPIMMVGTTWTGVIKTDDPATIERLEKEQKKEITEAQYLDLIKKKAQPPSSYPHFLPINPVSNVLPVAEAIIEAKKPPVRETPAPEPIKTNQVVQPAPIPRRKSQQV